MTNFIEQEAIDAFITQCHAVADFYGRLLKAAEGESSPRREAFIGRMTEIRAIAEGAPVTDYSLLCLADGLRHFHSNSIPYEELGLPVPAKVTDALQLRNALIEKLLPYLPEYGSSIQQIVSNLALGLIPSTEEELQTLLLTCQTVMLKTKHPLWTAEEIYGSMGLPSGGLSGPPISE